MLSLVTESVLVLDIILIASEKQYRIPVRLMVVIWSLAVRGRHFSFLSELANWSKGDIRLLEKGS